jgi:CBS domain-containing protein
MPLTVQEILDDKAPRGGQLHALAPGSPVREAVALMVREDIGSVVVLEGGELAGLVTLRELVKGLDSLGERLLDSPVRELMDAKPAVVRPEDSADTLRTTMTERHVTHVPVVKDRALVGIISFHDIARSAIKDVAFENKLLKQYIKNWPAS